MRDSESRSRYAFPRSPWPPTSCMLMFCTRCAPPMPSSFTWFTSCAVPLIVTNSPLQGFMATGSNGSSTLPPGSACAVSGAAGRSVTSAASNHFASFFTADLVRIVLSS